MTNTFASLVPEGGLVVSCQAPSDSPFRDPSLMSLMAIAAADGGAAAIRANGPEDVAAIAGAVTLPIIGIYKLGDPGGVFITPTVETALAVLAAGASIVALDGTRRDRADGTTLAGQIAGIRESSDAPIMADVDTLEAGLRARDAGADAIATTLAGYTGGSTADGVDIELIASLAKELDCPIVAEGRIRTDADVAAARAAGAYALVIGTAITNPVATTRSFVAALARTQVASPRA
jgi:N-acylglucosamine-6-phosphate 2-epimerase